MAETKSTHVAVLPSPGMGHLNPLAEFARRLVSLHDISVTFIIPTDGPPSKAQKSTLDSLPASIDHVFLPPVNLTDVANHAKIETLLSLTVVRSLPSLRDVLKSLTEKTHLVSLVVDLFGTDAFEVAREFNVAPYIFFTSTAMTLSLLLYLPELDQKASGEYRDLPEPVKIPGCIPIAGKELFDPLQDRKDDAYKCVVLHHAKRYRLADGIMVNSCKDLETGAIKALQEKEPGNPPVYPVGPLVNMDRSTKVDDAGCLTWLDRQPHGSVLYVSFGSGGTMSSNQIVELALGLEMSAQRFLWVVRGPNEVADGTYFGANSEKDSLQSLDFLPKGFLERTKGRGLVVPPWAPQAQVLSHSSTGGFLTHCGWNSSLESVVNGVPLITWPRYAEQKMNALMLTEDIKVALRPKANENGLVSRNEIARVIRGLMEGEDGQKVRSRMKDLKEAVAKVLSHDGSSTKALAEVVRKWQNN